MPKHSLDARNPNSKNGGTTRVRQPRGPQWEMHRKDGDVFYVRKDGSMVKVPSSGPPNTLILSGSILPLPKEETHQ